MNRIATVVVSLALLTSIGVAAAQDEANLLDLPPITAENASQIEQVASLLVQDETHIYYNYTVERIQISPDGTYIAFQLSDTNHSPRTEEQTVQVWDVATRTRLYTVRRNMNIASMIFSPDESLLAIAQREVWSSGITGPVEIFETHTGTEITTIQAVSGLPLPVITADNQWFIFLRSSGPMINRIAFYNLATDRLVHEIDTIQFVNDFGRFIFVKSFELHPIEQRLFFLSQQIIRSDGQTNSIIELHSIDWDNNRVGQAALLFTRDNADIYRDMVCLNNCETLVIPGTIGYRGLYEDPFAIYIYDIKRESLDIMENVEYLDSRIGIRLSEDSRQFIDVFDGTDLMLTEADATHPRIVFDDRIVPRIMSNQYLLYDVTTDEELAQLTINNAFRTTPIYSPTKNYFVARTQIDGGAEVTFWGVPN